jgi:hypothetical protein
MLLETGNELVFSLYKLGQGKILDFFPNNRLCDIIFLLKWVHLVKNCSFFEINKII